MADPRTPTGSPAAAPTFLGNEGKGDEKEVRILCFGDSLTEGYYNYGMAFSPYSETMERTIEWELNGGGDKGWSVEVRFEEGDTVGLKCDDSQERQGESADESLGCRLLLRG